MKLEIREEDISTIIGKLRAGKTPGRDGLKAELYKELVSSREVVRKLTMSYLKVIEHRGGRRT